MEKEEAQKLSYESARSEILLRMRLRDQMLLLYLGASGAIMGIAFSEKSINEILFVIPFFALAVTLLTSQHVITMAYLAHFCKTEFRSAFSNVPQWDDSEMLSKLKEHQTFLRSWGSMIIIVVPCIVSLTVNHQYSSVTESLMVLGVSWWLGLLLTGIVIYNIKVSHDLRNQLWKEN